MMMKNSSNINRVQQPMFEMDCNIQQDISRQDPRNKIVAPNETKENKNKAELLDMGWNAMASFDNEHSEMESLVHEFRQGQEKKAFQGRWALGLVFLAFLLVVGGMSFAIRPGSTRAIDPSEKKRPVMVRSKYQPH